MTIKIKVSHTRNQSVTFMISDNHDLCWPSFDSLYEVTEFTSTMLQMYKDAVKPVPVIFRIFREEVLALFPTLPGTNDPSTMTCYAHRGQHSTASMGITSEGRLATPEEYASLYDELTRIVGYSLKVIKRSTRYHYEQRKNEINRV